MTILNQAISAYRNEDFANALQLFYQAGEAYGSHLVATNIRLCQQALTEAGQSSACPPRISAKLDPATRIMLANAAELELTEAERTRLLAEYRLATHKKSEDAETQAVNPIPADWPKDLVLPPLPDSTNDYLWNRRRKSMLGVAPLLSSKSGLSIIIPTFNRSRILDVTLACLCNQQTRFPFEVIVADDGSREAIDLIVRQYESLLDIKYARQKDYGYQLCAVRNLGLRTAQYDFVAILDCDMAPNPLWVQSYMELLVQDDDVALIGPRKYVDTSSHDPESFRNDSNFLEKLPEIITNNDVAGKTEQTKSIDWRLDHFHKSDDLRLCDTPFRFFSGGNVAFAKKWLEKAGYFDEAFNHWGGEDNEFGYRLYRAGCYFRAVSGALAYHQEPPGKENETDRAAGKAITIKLVQEKVPYFYRKLEGLETANLHATPLVSIYIPAYNCAEHIVRCVNSALNQTVTDLEVCICDDGSTDNTLEIINQNFGGNPRVRVMSKSNGGIGSASNAAVHMARGYYIGQLDSDDYLEPDAVELCLKTFFSDRSLVCVYTTNRNVNPDGSLIANGYNWPEYSREKLMTAMILHHFRMFTARAWNLTNGFDEEITNAVDYDIYLKLSEIGSFKHLNKIAYNRVLHGGNTSIKKLGIQKLNHYLVVNKSLNRLGVKNYLYTPINNDDPSCRKYIFQNKKINTIASKEKEGEPPEFPTIGIINFSTLIKKTAGSFISSRELEWEDHVNRILDIDRLKNRSNFLTEITLPNFDLQVKEMNLKKFRLCILISNLLPINFKELLYKKSKDYPWITIEERDTNDYLDANGSIRRALLEIIGKNKDLQNKETVKFTSFRLDDDDFLSSTYLKTLNNIVSKNTPGKFITFSNGVKGLWNDQCSKIENIVQTERPLIAIGLAHIGEFNTKEDIYKTEPNTVFAGISHYDLSKNFQIIEDKTAEMFFWSQHKHQDTAGRFKSTEIQKKWDRIPVQDEKLLANFPLLKIFNKKLIEEKL